MMFTLIFRYLGLRYLQTVLLTTLGLGLFVYILDTVELLRRLSNQPEASAKLAFALAGLKLPYMLLQIAPFALLIATLLAFTTLNKHKELVALRSSGLPARLFLFPAIAVCLSVGLFNLFVINPVAATALKQFERQQSQLFPGSTEGVLTAGGEIWLRQPENQGTLFLYARSVNAGGDALQDVAIFVFDTQGRFSTRWQATNMHWVEEHWLLENAQKLSATEPPTKLDFAKLNIRLTPTAIQDSLTSPQTQSIWELSRFISYLKQAGLPSAAHELYYHRTLATPLLMLAMVLLAAPFALHTSRNIAVGKLIVAGLGIGFGFYLFSSIIATYGLAGRMHPILAAWAPAGVALLMGTALFVQFREE